jgi:hypothetical protein
VHVLDAENVELVGSPDRDLLGVVGGVHGDPALTLRAPEDAAEECERFLDGLVGERAGQQSLA